MEVQFTIHGDIPGLTDVTPKGGVLEGGVFTTSDAPWIKHLRQLDDSIAEEI